MKSFTATEGDMPRSTSTWPESRIPAVAGPVLHARNVLVGAVAPCSSGAVVRYAITRANWAVTRPPSPKKPWVKFPELRANVVSPSANDCSSVVTPAQAVRTTLTVLYGGALEISQKTCPNSFEVSGGFPGLKSFSIRSVARPVNGAGLDGSGVVEYSAKTESSEHAVPPAGRHTVPRYCGRSEMLYSVISTLKPPDTETTL